MRSGKKKKHPNWKGRPSPYNNPNLHGTEKVEQLANGKFQFVDRETGEVKNIQEDSLKNKERIKQGRKPRYFHWQRYQWKRNRNGRALLVPKDMSARDLPDDYVHFRDDEVMRQNILLAIQSGATLKGLSRIDGMPPFHVIWAWYCKDEEFKKQISEARKARAEMFHDELVELADKVKEGNAKSSKVKVDIYKHLMEVNDRERFGAQTKVVGDPNAPIQIFVNTGIDDDDEPIKVEGRTLSIDGLLPEATTEGNSQEAQEVQCTGVPSPVWEDSVVHQCVDPRLPEEPESES